MTIDGEKLAGNEQRPVEDFHEMKKTDQAPHNAQASEAASGPDTLSKVKTDLRILIKMWFPGSSSGPKLVSLLFGPKDVYAPSASTIQRRLTDERPIPDLIIQALTRLLQPRCSNEFGAILARYNHLVSGRIPNTQHVSPVLENAKRSGFKDSYVEAARQMNMALRRILTDQYIMNNLYGNEMIIELLMQTIDLQTAQIKYRTYIDIARVNAICKNYERAIVMVNAADNVIVASGPGDKNEDRDWPNRARSLSLQIRAEIEMFRHRWSYAAKLAEVSLSRISEKQKEAMVAGLEPSLIAARTGIIGIGLLASTRGSTFDKLLYAMKLECDPPAASKEGAAKWLHWAGVVLYERGLFEASRRALQRAFILRSYLEFRGAEETKKWLDLTRPLDAQEPAIEIQRAAAEGVSKMIELVDCTWPSRPNSSPD